MFSNEIIRDQYRFLKYYIDLVFPVHKLGTEIDENGHLNRSGAEKQKRHELIKKETGFKIIRINPDKENFEVFDEIGKIQNYIIESTNVITEQSTKKSILDDSEKLLKMVKHFCL